MKVGHWLARGSCYQDLIHSTKYMSSYGLCNSVDRRPEGPTAREIIYPSEAHQAYLNTVENHEQIVFHYVKLAVIIPCLQRTAL